MEAARVEAALAWARERYHRCDVCARRCGVDRHAGELGFCGLPAGARVYKEYLHLGEEAELCPSHTIFLSGCSLRCAFCSDLGPVEAPLEHGVGASPEALARRIARRRTEGARNVNLVGGVPDVNLLFLLQTLALCPEDTRVVWNTNLWSTAEVVEQLEGVVDVWLADHKFGDDRCGLRLAGVRGYTGVLEPLLTQVGAGRGELLVRHLLMPGHVACCTEPVLAWLERHVPDATVNLMTAYHPFGLAGSADPMGGRLQAAERDGALELLARTRTARRLLDGVEWAGAG